MNRVICLILLFVMPIPPVAAGIEHSVHIRDYAKSGDDVSTVLQHLVDNYNTVFVDEGTWFISSGIKLHSGTSIIGLGKDRSIIKRNDSTPLNGGFLFYTETINPDIYIQRNPEDLFNKELISHTDIVIRDLTIDFNRKPERYKDIELKSRNLYGIGLIRASRCVISGCSFIDHMTKTCNNGYPAIVSFQSEKLVVENNHCRNMTFLQVWNSKGVTVRGNTCTNSVGTAIETSGGLAHIIERNTVNSVFWSVSCVGVNSTDCYIAGNTIYGEAHNLSALTLGHEGAYTSASRAVVKNNEFYTNGDVGVLIQNGHNILVTENNCSCCLSPSSSELSSGCIVASGNDREIYDIKVSDNNLTATGEGKSGGITYRGSGKLEIKGNDISSNKGISVLNQDCAARIQKNSIQSQYYTIQANCNRVLIKGNILTNGIVSSSSNIRIINNDIEIRSHNSFFINNRGKVSIVGNSIIPAESIPADRAFVLDASGRGDKEISKAVKVKKNSIQDVGNNGVVYFAGSSEGRGEVKTKKKK